MKKFKYIYIFILLTFVSGCFNHHSMENIKINTTAYPIEYITNRLYSEHGEVASIYPNDMENDYVVSKKLLKDYSSASLFIFNDNVDNENEYMHVMTKNNKDLKIINATASLTYHYGVEELWLDPIKLLTITNNVKKGFEEYTDTTYILNDVKENYSELKNELVQLDANYREIANRANNKKLIVGNDVLLYLKKYNLDVISLDESEELTQKVVHDAENLIKDGSIKNIYITKGSKINKTVEQLKNEYNVNIIEINTLYTLTEEDRKNNKDYLTIMYDNLELLKEQLYN